MTTEYNDINKVILFQIDQTSKIAKQYSQRELDRRELGITVDQWVLLKIIEESAPLSQKELGMRSKRDPASITRTLDLLEKKGLIERASMENNRRQYNILLTPAGADFVSANMGLITGLRERSVEGFSNQELEQLHSMLKRIQENMV